MFVFYNVIPNSSNTIMIVSQKDYSDNCFLDLFFIPYFTKEYRIVEIWFCWPI